MVLVRKTELGCRNNWDQDLWELAPELAGEGEEPDIHIPDPQHIPASADGSPHAATSSRHGDMFTDRLKSITVAPPRETATKKPGSEDDFDPTADRSDVRAARRRRVEQLERDRHEQQRERADEARKLLESDPEPTPKPEEQRKQSAEVKQKFTPAPERQPAAPRPSHVQRPAPQPQRSAPPRRPVVPQTPSMQQNRPVYDAFSPDSSISFGASPGSFERKSQPSMRKPQPQQSSVPPARPTPSPPAEPRPAMMQQDTDPLPTYEVRALQAGAQERRSQRFSQTAKPGSGGEPRGERASRAVDVEPPVEERDPGWMLWAGQIDGPRTTPARSEPPPPAVEEFSPTASEPQIGASSARPPARPRQQQMPRCCATCRDFRPVGDGTTGWCTNEYAPTAKHMVESGDLACETSVGSWWLANDVIWLERADTTHHSRPTPLLDDLYRAGLDSDPDDPTYRD